MVGLSDETSQQLVLITGLSGGGKTTALHALEDLGYYCVDNLPAALLPDFTAHIRGDPRLYGRVSLGVDARSRGPKLQRIPAWMDEMAGDGLSPRLLFLTADTRTLIKRFSETRRRHPLTRDQHALPAAIEREKQLLEPLKQRADWVLDTSDINIHQLRGQVWKAIGESGQGMTVVLESFAFKKGVPQDVDFVFDARHLPNPYWLDELRGLKGTDDAVAEWLERDSVVHELYEDIRAFLERWLPRVSRSQRSYVTVGIGCTGGRHRSVYLVERLATELRERFSPVVLHHRDLAA
ncbi:RNase adapter RapZ [Elongatibacter sediminis]|uniref:RNase adapter RapZ n=1 Tax=Elongatibacter sediminis TaxID=3119006 RepID=A0AAW9R9B7_9GAMM